MPLLPRLVEEPEPQVIHVPAGRNPLILPIVAALVLLAFVGGLIVASLNGVVDLPAPLQAEKPAASSPVPATKKPDRSNPPREVPVVAPKSDTKTTEPTKAPEEPTAEPTPTVSETAPSTPPETSEPVDPPSSSPPTEAPTTPPVETEEPTTTPSSPETEVPTTPTDPQTSQSVDTGTPTP